MVVPFFLKTALRAESAWGVMPGRIPSSSLTTMSFSLPCTHWQCVMRPSLIYHTRLTELSKLYPLCMSPLVKRSPMRSCKAVHTISSESRAAHLLVLDDGLDGDDLVLEAAAGARLGGAVVAAGRHLVLLLARDPVAGRNVLRGHTCTVRLRMLLHATIMSCTRDECRLDSTAQLDKVLGETEQGCQNKLASACGKCLNCFIHKRRPAVQALQQAKRELIPVAFQIRDALHM